MTEAYPVRVAVRSPPRFDRVQLLLRLALAFALTWVGITAGWLTGALYVLLPVVAAVAISSIGGARFTGELAPRLWRVLRWLVQLSAYMLMLVDEFPTGDDDGVQVGLRVTGDPTVGSALGRLVTSLPSGLVLCVLWIPSSVVWLVTAVMVLVGARPPGSLLAFQRGVVRWQARLVAYHASLVDVFPPFSFDTDADDGDGHATQRAAPGSPGDVTPGAPGA
jgi:hypothetical protein